MKKPEVIEVFNDDGSHSHWKLINVEMGKELWSEDQENFSFDEIIHPVIKWMNAPERHPHMKIIVESTGAELVEGVKSTGEVLEYLKD